MRNLTRIFAGLLSLTMLFSMTACGGSSEGGSNGGGGSAESPAEDSSHYKEKDDVSIAEAEVGDAKDLGGEAIYWLADYDLNPKNNNDRSVALTLFEDQFHGKVEYVACTSDTKFETLTNRILGGDPVDMFPYEWDALPNGVYKDQYQPLDDYIDLDDEVWDGIRDAIDMYEYNGKHYVVPYAVSDPLLITYSRTMCEENGLDDPYELYKKDKWDWDAFMDMMKTFVKNGDGSSERYGICGWFGQAVVQSTGKTIINFDGKQFTNNISDPDIEAAENLMAEMHNLNLYDPNWYGNFPDTGNILFYGMADWALNASNAKNPDADLMVVPFPKSPDADEYYLCGNYAAKMLVKNSTKGDAVGTYILCERLAETNDEYREAAKQKALIQEKTASGSVVGYRTEEQYDAIVEYKEDTTTVFDFGYGMGATMYGDGEYTYETRGIMNNLMDALLSYPDSVDSWAVLRDNWSAAIDDVIKTYNAALE